MKRYWFLFGILLIWSCTKEDNSPNPFDGEIVNQDTVTLQILDADPNSIAGIYQNVFKPTCANVGCHDGTFEPDFRSIESAYNTMIYQVPIKNDGNYTYRVHPGNPSGSVLLSRLENRLTPSMPIQIEPDSDWPTKMDEYIQNIRNWIAAGAPDVTGTVRQSEHVTATLRGAGVSVDGVWINRAKNQGPLVLSDTTEVVTLYFAFDHRELPSNQLTYNKIAFDADLNGFDSTQVTMDLEVMPSPISNRGFYGSMEEYTHSITLDLQSVLGTAVEQWFIRVYVKDEKNDITELPSDEGIYYAKEYMSIKWKS